MQPTFCHSGHFWLYATEIGMLKLLARLQAGCQYFPWMSCVILGWLRVWMIDGALGAMSIGMSFGNE